MISFLYIDPGTGSMLFSILIGVISTLVFFGRKLVLKIKFFLTGGKIEKITSEKIPIVLFNEHKRYWNVFKPVCDEFEKRKINVVYWTASPDDPALSENYSFVKTQFIGQGNQAFTKVNMMNAGICVSTTPGLNVYQWKRSKNVDKYVHLFHSVSDGTGYRMFGLDFYDTILSGGPIIEQELNKVLAKRNIAPKEYVVTGITYMDELKERLDQYKKINVSKQNNEHTVLLAPSWGETAILSRYGSKIIEALLKTDYKIIIRPHPQSFISEKQLIESLRSQYPDSERITWDSNPDNFKSLYESDLMLSDFSGVIFDYSLIFEKPIIYVNVNYNPAVYDAYWLDDEKWMVSILPLLGRQLNQDDFENLQGFLDKTRTDKDIVKNRKEIADQCWCHIGHSKEKIVDFLMKVKL